MRTLNFLRNATSLNAIFIFIILSIATIFFILIYIQRELDFSNEYNGQELQRKIAYEEFKKSIEWNDYYREYLSVKYDMPDTLNREDPRFKYIKANPKLPDYIKKALIEREPIFLMTIGELFLAIPELADEAIVVQPKRSPNYLEIGHEKYFSKRNRSIAGGTVYSFKNGFLVLYGTV